MENVVLFSGGPTWDMTRNLASALGETARKVADRLQSWDPDSLLNTPVDDVIDCLINEGSVRCPQLYTEGNFLLEPSEVTHDVSDFGRHYTRRVPRFVLVVPFDGEKDVFTVRADQFSFNPPQVLELNDQEIRLAIDDPPNDPAVIKARFDEQIGRIEECLSWSRTQVDMHNRHIRDEVPGMVTRRREQLLATRNLQAEIGYPVRRRADADTYSVPIKRRTVRPRQNGSSRPKFRWLRVGVWGLTCGDGLEASLICSH